MFAFIGKEHFQAPAGFARISRHRLGLILTDWTHVNSTEMGIVSSGWAAFSVSALDAIFAII